MVVFQSDLRSAIQIAATFYYLNPVRPNFPPESRVSVRSSAAVLPSVRLRALYASNAVETTADKPSICTADELHYVSVRNSDWRLALWRYKPSPKAPPRNHPLLLLSGVGTNAIGYDLSPGSSFARYMSSQGYDTWILEVRGAGLSTGVESQEVKQSISAISEQLIDSTVKHESYGVYSAELLPSVNSDVSAESEVSSAKEKRTEKVTKSDDLQLVTKLTETLMRLSERLSGLLNEGLLEVRQNSVIASQIRDLSQRLINIIEGQRLVSPQFIDFTTIVDFQKQLDLIVKYNWDFDHYLEEDVPAAMDYIRTQCKPKDGKLLAIGHSMGGILLYAMVSRNGFEGRDSKLAAVITLASSLDYTTSKSSLKLLLPLANPAQALNVPVIPLEHDASRIV
ncbi:hypothetical protein F0562_025256 [Nyssa sinensis]|uniref:AB hydrolase-1 domain-containing protein n=1 Tax=Nyssa sinensis TaxID=561372 RepID=A0A5J5BDX1_9ASTE|nr:hypothetical protein F0562_025256 [Nyssa sinensis]